MSASETEMREGGRGRKGGREGGREGEGEGGREGGRGGGRAGRKEEKVTCTYTYIRSDIENCEGWLSPGGHSSGGISLVPSLSHRKHAIIDDLCTRKDMLWESLVLNAIFLVHDAIL